MTQTIIYSSDKDCDQLTSIAILAKNYREEHPDSTENNTEAILLTQPYKQDELTGNYVGALDDYLPSYLKDVIILGYGTRQLRLLAELSADALADKNVTIISRFSDLKQIPELNKPNVKFLSGLDSGWTNHTPWGDKVVPTLATLSKGSSPHSFCDYLAKFSEVFINRRYNYSNVALDSEDYNSTLNIAINMFLNATYNPDYSISQLAQPFNTKFFIPQLDKFNYQAEGNELLQNVLVYMGDDSTKTVSYHLVIAPMRDADWITNLSVLSDSKVPVIIVEYGSTLTIKAFTMNSNKNMISFIKELLPNARCYGNYNVGIANLSENITELTQNIFFNHSDN